MLLVFNLLKITLSYFQVVSGMQAEGVLWAETTALLTSSELPTCCQLFIGNMCHVILTIIIVRMLLILTYMFEYYYMRTLVHDNF